MIQHMESAIVVGPITLRQMQDGTVQVEHVALKHPAQVDSKQLQRWLLKQLRDQVTFTAKVTA
tara:strand:- start:581 stop:769 length:189 start_codon:yes stop_codon:yes gene_type:complete